MKDLKKYVIEFFVIVFSILAAFGLESWNENSQKSKLEIENLRALYNDISANALSIKEKIAADSLIASQSFYLLKILDDNGSQFHDSLTNYFAMANRYYPFFPRRIAYDALKNQGIDLIRNKILLSNIVNLYDN